MTLDQLRKAHQASPFHPFTIYLADGRDIHITHPEFMYIPPKNERTFVVTDQNGLMESVDLLLVTSIKQGDRPSRRRKSA